MLARIKNFVSAQVQYLIDSSEGEDSDFQPDDDDMM